MGKWGAAIMPGSKEVLDWETGKLEACTADTCPYAIDGVNHAPFAAFGGWGGGINATANPKVKDAAYAFFSYMTPARAVELGRDHRRHRLQSLPHLAALLQRALEEGRHERGGGQGLSRRHQRRA